MARPDCPRGVPITTDLTNPAEPSPAAPPPPPKPASEAARRFAVDAARLASYTRCTEVVVLDVSRVSPVTDFYVIGTGSSGRQMRAVANQVEELGGGQKFKALGRHGYEGESWLLCDFVDVVLHLFSPTSRGYYDLDGLWGDAVVVDWQTGAPPPPNAADRPAFDDDEDDDDILPIKSSVADEDEDDFDEEDDESGDEAFDESDEDDDDDEPDADDEAE